MPPHEAQRELERRALRNVRNLVDKVESAESARRRGSIRLLGWLILGMVLAVALAYAAIRFTRGPGETRIIQIEPAKQGAPASRSPQ